CRLARLLRGQCRHDRYPGGAEPGVPVSAAREPCPRPSSFKQSKPVTRRLGREEPFMDLTARELATVLAALRYWQRSLTEGATPPITEQFADATPLDAGAIDELCERLNTQPENRLAFGADHPLTIKRF